MARPRNVKRILNVLPSPNQEQDWLFEQARGAGVAEAAPPVPAQKDLRNPAWWKVGDQGSTGSCVGWATADSVLRWHFVKAKRLPEADRLSPRFHWMAAKETDQFNNSPTTFLERDGTSLKAALDVARKFGAVRDKLLPFASGALYAGDPKTFYATAAQLKISSYYNLGKNLALWRQWLAANGPILTRLDVDDTWDKAKANKGNLDAYLPKTKRGGHAVALVGFTPDRFIVRNSWGTGWGDAGFGYASLGYAQAAFTEAYGISL